MIEQVGLVGLIGFLAVKEALGYFRSKESAESKLVETLVADLRRTQEQLLGKLFDLHSQQHKDLQALEQRMGEVCDKLDKLL